MGTALYDSVDDIINLINDKWNTGSDDAGILPRVVKIWDEKTIGYGNSRQATILVEPKKETIDYFNLYGTDFLHEISIKLDVRTYLDDYVHDKIINEVLRIIKDNVRRDNYVDLRVISSEPLSHLYRNMFRHMVEVSYRKINP